MLFRSEMKSSHENDTKDLELDKLALELYQQGKTKRELERMFKVRNGRFKNINIPCPQVPEIDSGTTGLEPNVEE